ncbi:MAG: RecX family transcriptional regulator [Chloroflexales bacterium]|nr:RecX family transcriptional regulator [Chloroflexales bacterium]
MPTGKITALRAQSHDSQRVNVFIDDVFAIGVSLNTVVRENLFVGKEVDASAWNRLETVESADKALQAALRFLETRPRSITEVRERLRRKAFGETSIEAAITRLTDLELLDDNAFAQFWVENRLACRPRGARALRDELRRKGVAGSIVESTLANNELMADDSERALTLARAALRKYRDAPDRFNFQRRMGGYLQRRGFDFDTITPILDLLWKELQSETEEVSRATNE